jgi:eukaryotic-like serine/threonine-protein kinase
MIGSCSVTTHPDQPARSMRPATNDSSGDRGARTPMSEGGSSSLRDPGELVRLAWEALGPNAGSSVNAPDLVKILRDSGAPDRGPGFLVDAVIADAEERWSRRLEGSVEYYHDSLSPAGIDVLGHADLCRGLVMAECAHRSNVSTDDLAREFASRLPSLKSEIDAVLEMLSLMRGAAVEQAQRELKPGMNLGKYRLIEFLGAGRFGEVWSAWDRTLERYVALKLLVGAGDDPQTYSRVLREAQAAAAIDHQNVVKVHDAGRFNETSHCFIDSQLVGDSEPAPGDPKRLRVGRPLGVSLGTGDVRWKPATGAEMNVRDAVRLMEQASRGVAAAHALGVIHRDIKPSNILVTPSGRPMVADFGLSVAASRTASPTSAGSGAGGGKIARDATIVLERNGKRIVGTPAYMSPEQARGERATPASDVYGLGATLRYLLTGRPPFEPSHSASGDSSWDVIEQVRRGSRDRLSSVRPDLPPDVSAICDRAMAHDPKDRYVSAQQMAEDLSAWLSHRSVSARPAGGARSLALWGRRNLPLAASLSVFLLASVIGVWWYVVSVGEQRDRAVAAEQDSARRRIEAETLRDRESKARENAERESQTSTYLTSFLTDMLESPDPDISGRDIKVRDLLSKWGGTIDASFADRPAIAAAAHGAIGRACLALGLVAEARSHLVPAHEIRTRDLGPEHPDTIQSGQDLGRLLELEGKPVEGREHLELLLPKASRLRGDDSDTALEIRHGIARCLQLERKLPQAEEVIRKVVEVRRAKLGDEAAPTLLSGALLAQILSDMARGKEAAEILESLVEISRRTLKPSNTNRLLYTNNWAIQLRAQGRIADAEAAYREAWDLAKSSLGPDHLYALNIESNLGVLLKEDNRLSDAEPFFRHVYESRTAQLGDEHPASVLALSNVAALLVAQKKLDEGIATHRRVLDLRLRATPVDKRAVLNTKANLAAALREAKVFAESERILAEAMADAPVSLPENHPVTISILRQHGLLMIDLERYPEAEQSLTAAYDACAKSMTEKNPRTRDSARSLQELYEAWGKAEAAEQWKAKAEAK